MWIEHQTMPCNRKSNEHPWFLPKTGVETGQMSAVGTGQMSAAETGQMSSVARADICLVTPHNVDVSEVSTVPIPHCSSHRDLNRGTSEIFIVAISQCSSLRSLNCGKVTAFKSHGSHLFKTQIGGLALNRRKWVERGPEWSPGPENRSP